MGAESDKTQNKTHTGSPAPSADQKSHQPGSMTTPMGDKAGQSSTPATAKVDEPTK